jgi:outer membrane protein
MRSKLIALIAAPAILGAQQMQPTGVDTTYHQISLADALKLAHENNVQNIASDNAIRTASNSVRQARAAVLPTLNFSAGQNKRSGQNVGQSGTLVDYVSDWGYSTNFSSQVTLFDAGKMFADVKTAKANLAASQAAEVSTEYNISQQVKVAYNSVLAAKESEEAARAQLATAQLQLQTSIAKVNAGAANVSDSLNSVVLVGNAQLAVLTAQNNFRTQSAALTRLVGTNYFVTAQLADTVDHLLSPIDSATIMDWALSGPAVRQSAAQINALSAARRSAKTAYLPTVTASFSYGGNGTRAIYGLSNDPFPYSKSINISLNYNIFNRWQRENQIATATVNLENAQAQARDTRLAAQQNVVTALAALRNAEAAITVQQTNVRASQEALRVVTQRYNLGASTLLDVTTAQQNLANAQQQLIQARLNYRNARAQIEATIGRDLP